ncbi:hypothetical protein MYCSP_20525 [Mycobacteroides saopaulense]|nr:hypothetical protein MYCSP_20525 [Mycobacteroides saopaulense]
MFGGVHDRGTQPISPPITIYRNAFHIPGAQRAALVQQAALDDGRMGDEYAVVPDERVHPAEAVFPVFFGEFALECFDK